MEMPLFFMVAFLEREQLRLVLQSAYINTPRSRRPSH